MFKKLVVIILILIILFTFSAVYIYRSTKEFLTTPYKYEKKEVLVQIKRGMSDTDVADLVYKHGLVSDRKKFYYFLRFLHRNRGLEVKAGEYLLSTNMTPWQIAEKLIKREVVKYKVTIPEGLRFEEVAQILDREKIAYYDEFVSLCQDRVFLSSIGIEGENCEGYLLPDTYLFERNLNAKDIFRQINDEFKRRITAGYIEKAKEIGFSLYEILIIASMIEKEARIDEERTLISSVIHNRLKRGMGLYIDATVIYGLIREKGGFNGNLTRRDLETPTRYNTYIIKGLPPTPICNPGIKSINAALMPAKTSYLYYVSKNDGSHYFCETLECHNKAVYKYQIEYYRKVRR
ncbi:MAG: endolytic transglycosylase MltG [Deltaproteobacteria bacterium]|nr:endolytic transglycosylase MltG [Deltaproteobacteria bacterium]